MAPTATHADHEYIVARQQRYIEAWSTGSAEKTMEFMDKEDFGSCRCQRPLHPLVFGPSRCETQDTLPARTQTLYGLGMVNDIQIRKGAGWKTVAQGRGTAAKADRMHFDVVE